MPSGNKPLSESLLTNIIVAIWGYWGVKSWHIKAATKWVILQTFSNAFSWMKNLHACILMQICSSWQYISIGSGNGLVQHREHAITWTNDALDGAVFNIAQILAYLVHNMSRSQLYLGFGHFGWLPSFSGQKHFGGLMVKLYFLCWNYSFSSGWHIIAA